MSTPGWGGGWHEVLPKALQFGGRSPQTTWEMYHRATGVQITECPTSAAGSSSQRFAVGDRQGRLGAAVRGQGWATQSIIPPPPHPFALIRISAYRFIVQLFGQRLQTRDLQDHKRGHGWTPLCKPHTPTVLLGGAAEEARGRMLSPQWYPTAGDAYASTWHPIEDPPTQSPLPPVEIRSRPTVAAARFQFTQVQIRMGGRGTGEEARDPIEVSYAKVW